MGLVRESRRAGRISKEAPRPPEGLSAHGKAAVQPTGITALVLRGHSSSAAPGPSGGSCPRHTQTTARRTEGVRALVSVSAGPQRQQGHGTQKSKGEGGQREWGLQCGQEPTAHKLCGGRWVMAVTAPGQVAEGLHISSTSWMSSHPLHNPPPILPPHTNHHRPEQQPEATAEASLILQCPSPIASPTEKA